MGTKHIKFCDKCSKDGFTKPLEVYAGSRFNGVDRDHYYRRIDLCLDCCITALQTQFDKDDAELNQVILNECGLGKCGVEV